MLLGMHNVACVDGTLASNNHLEGLPVPLLLCGNAFGGNVAQTGLPPKGYLQSRPVLLLPVPRCQLSDRQLGRVVARQAPLGKGHLWPQRMRFKLR